MCMRNTIAIIGSSGRNPASWLEAFLQAGFTVRNLVRDASGRAGRQGVDYVGFDLDDRSAHASVLDGVDVLALVTPADPRQIERELGLIEAAKASGIRRIVNLSVIGADLP